MESASAYARWVETFVADRTCGWGGPGGRDAFETRHVSDGRGWAGEVDEGAKACGLVLLFTGRRAGRVESWGAQEVRVECKVVSAIATAEFL